METLNEVYEEYILRGHPFSEAQARCLPRPEIVPCRFLSEANQIGAFASYQKAFWKIDGQNARSCVILGVTGGRNNAGDQFVLWDSDHNVLQRP